MRTTRWLAAAALLALFLTPALAQRPPQPPASTRLYAFDCGTLEADVTRFSLKPEEVATPLLSVGCYLIAHPRGTLMWDVGAVPDSQVTPGGKPIRYHLKLSESAERFVTLEQSLAAMLAGAGYRPADVTYLALSHYHYDHSANANAFAGATWLVRPVERDAMLSDKPPELLQPQHYNLLRNSKTVLIKTDDHDVFGDGTVVIKATPGHTPGHSVLYVKLAKTGPVVLSGDLYHYPEERTLSRIPGFDVDQKQTAVSRAALDTFLKSSGAQLWIQHDFNAFKKLKKAPAYYD